MLPDLLLSDAELSDIVSAGTPIWDALEVELGLSSAPDSSLPYGDVTLELLHEVPEAPPVGEHYPELPVSTDPALVVDQEATQILGLLDLPEVAA